MIINPEERVLFKTTKIFTEFSESIKKFRVFQGGTRSSKTYNIMFAWIIKLIKEEDKVLTIGRETMPSLKATVFRDFEEIMKRLKLWNENNMRWSDMVYKLGANIIEFRNLDDAQKVKGAKRNYLWLNEANEVPYPIFKQLIFRTSEIVCLDYNPSDEFHYIYDEVITRDDCDFFQSTYLDNPFLSKAEVFEIERLKEKDPNYWKVYGLGQRGISEATIYKNWELLKGKFPEGETYYGLDFGFNHPNALIQATFYDDELYVRQRIYKNQLTTPELVEEMKRVGIKSTDTIFADSSRPDTIQEIFNCGFNIHKCKKGAGSIKAGIDWVKRNKMYIHKESLELIKEAKSYKWKVDKNEKVLDVPVDVNDHGMDALRYAMTSKMGVQNTYDVAESLDVAF